MPVRAPTRTIPGSVFVDKKLRLIYGHTDHDEDPVVARALFTILDRESALISNTQKKHWDDLKFIHSDLLKNDQYRDEYTQHLVIRHIVSNLHELLRALIDPNDYMVQNNLNKLDPNVTQLDVTRQFLTQFYDLLITDLSTCFRANPALSYKAAIEIEGVLMPNPLDLKHTYDLPTLIFGLFDNHPYSHLSRQTQLKLGIPDWKTRRRPSQYSLRLLGLIVTCWKEFHFRDPLDTQELINVIAAIMFNFMRRTNYLGFQKILTRDPEQPALTIIDRNLTPISLWEDFYYTFRIGAQYLETRPNSSDIITKYQLGL